MQCLYCDSELKPFRGLFDEDFCSREHRDKYFASFRKSLNRLPVLDFPPTPAAESLSPAVPQFGESVFSQDSPKFPDALDDRQHTEGLANGEPADEQFVPPLEISAETNDLPSLPATYTVGEPGPTGSSAVDSEEIPFGPPSADFLPVVVAAMAGAQSAQSAGLDALPVSYAIEFPAGVMPWSAVLALEQRPAELLDPPEKAAATAFAPMPTPLELPAESPAITQAAAMLPEAALPGGAAESTAHSLHQGASGYASLWNHADPLAPAPLALVLAPFSPAADGAAWMPSAEFAELTLTCQALASSPIAAPQIALAHEFYAPVFTPSAEPALADEERDDIHAAISDELPADSPAPSEIAPAFMMNSAPLDSPAFMPARAAEMMPPALALSSASAPLTAPGLASTIDGQPALAPELMADIPQSPAANQPAQPRSLAPLRQLFGSSVRIKNWRLRITFAKPA